MSPDPSDENAENATSEAKASETVGSTEVPPQEQLAAEDGPSADHLCYRHAPPIAKGTFLTDQQELFQMETHGCQRCGTPVEVVFRRSRVVIDGNPRPVDEYDPSEFVALGTAVVFPEFDQSAGIEALDFDVPSVPRDHPLGSKRVLIRYHYDATIVDGHAIDERDGRQLRYLVNEAPNAEAPYLTSPGESGTEDGETASEPPDYDRSTESEPDNGSVGSGDAEVSSSGEQSSSGQTDANVREHLFEADTE
jgi:hypothetical protein